MSPKIQPSQAAIGGGKKGKVPDIENAEVRLRCSHGRCT